MMCLPMEPMGLPLQFIGNRWDFEDSPCGLMRTAMHGRDDTADDFGDSPRDHVLAKLERTVDEAPSTSKETVSTTEAPVTHSRSRRRNRRGTAVAPPQPDGSSDGSEGCSQAGSQDSWPMGATTVMLRNIPNRYTAEELIAEMLALGFENCFDFFYLPIDFHTKRNRGYAFVNFHVPDNAKGFVAAFHQQRLTRYSTQKILEVAPALTQGFEANVAQFVRKDAQRIQNPWFRPMIFARNGELQEQDVSTEPGSSPSSEES